VTKERRKAKTKTRNSANHVGETELGDKRKYKKMMPLHGKDQKKMKHGWRDLSVQGLTIQAGKVGKSQETSTILRVVRTDLMYERRVKGNEVRFPAKKVRRKKGQKKRASHPSKCRKLSLTRSMEGGEKWDTFTKARPKKKGQDRYKRCWGGPVKNLVPQGRSSHVGRRPLI